MEKFNAVMDKEYAFETKHKAKHYKKMQKKMLDRAIQEHKKGNMLLEKDYLANGTTHLDEIKKEGKK